MNTDKHWGNEEISGLATSYIKRVKSLKLEEKKKLKRRELKATRLHEKKQQRMARRKEFLEEGIRLKIGEKGERDQRIADMLGLNASDVKDHKDRKYVTNLEMGDLN